MSSSSSTTSKFVVLALCLAAVQASAIGRKVVEGKDTVDVTNNGITIKTGYESYLHKQPETAVAESRKDDWLPASTLDLYKAALMYHASFLPAIGMKITKVILHFAIALFVGIGVTTAVCSFTPLCNINFNANKPSFLSENHEMFPALREAFEIVSQIPNFFKKQEKPAPVQPGQLSAESDDVLEKIPEQEIDPRTPRKSINVESRSAKTLEPDVKENEA